MSRCCATALFTGFDVAVHITNTLASLCCWFSSALAVAARVDNLAAASTAVAVLLLWLTSFVPQDKQNVLWYLRA